MPASPRPTTFSRAMSHSRELGRHHGFPRPAGPAPRLGAPAGVPRLRLMAGRPISPEPSVQEGEPAPADLLGPRGTGAPGARALGRGHDHLVLDRLACRVRYTPVPVLARVS